MEPERNFFNERSLRIISFILPAWGFLIALNETLKLRKERATLAWTWFLYGMFFYIGLGFVIHIVANQ